MAKGVIYITTTTVPGLIKIGQCETKQFPERMRNLERNGYYNVSGLKRQFAIEVEDYDDKERLIHEVFAKHRVNDSELFALDIELAKQLLLCFEGKVIYPEDTDKEKTFGSVSRARKKEKMFNFYRKGITDGSTIVFKHDESITAKVVGGREVKFDGEVRYLSPLTCEIMEKLGRLNDSKTYRGADYWNYNGVQLSKIKDRS